MLTKACAIMQRQTLGDSGEKMSHTDGTGEISPEVAVLLPTSVYEGKVDDEEVPLLIFLDV